MTTLSPSEQATIDAHFQHAQTTSLMPVPNVIAQLVGQRDDAIAALQALAGEHQIALAEIRLLRDQQHAGEPEGTWDQLRVMAGFTADDPTPPEVPTRVMPARALRHDRQAIGLLW